MTQQKWTNATHDWTASVDRGHLERIRKPPAEFAPTGVLHLVLEVLAYAADEAEAHHAGSATVTLEADETVTVADDGRGTDTRRTDAGVVVKKPVMATPDLRFFDGPGIELLADGHRRRGISVVAALSDWLVHVNRRRDGAWQQRYERGVPVTGLEPLAPNGRTGTAVRFRASSQLAALPSGMPPDEDRGTDGNPADRRDRPSKVGAPRSMAGAFRAAAQQARAAATTPEKPAHHLCWRTEHRPADIHSTSMTSGRANAFQKRPASCGASIRRPCTSGHTR